MTTTIADSKMGVSNASRMAGDYEVTHFVTLEDSQGFFYLMADNGQTPRWTMEHDDAHDFCSEQAAVNAASAFNYRDGKVSTLVSARRRPAIQLIGEAALPEQFRSENIYKGSDEEFKARSLAFRAYCKANKIYYYGRPRESFHSWEAYKLAQAAGCTKLLLDDMS